MSKESNQEVFVKESSKRYINVIQSLSLRSLIERVNNWNSQCASPSDMILKEDVIGIMKENEIFLFLYYGKALK